VELRWTLYARHSDLRLLITNSIYDYLWKSVLQDGSAVEFDSPNDDVAFKWWFGS
jgi:hypothetical protein